MRRDRAIILICLGTSLLFWFFVKLSQQYLVRRVVELNYTLPEDQAFVKMPPSKAYANLKGDGWDLLRLYFRKTIELNLDASNQYDGIVSEATLVRAVEEIIRNDAILVNSIEFEEIELNFEEAISKMIPVHLRGSFSFGPEYQFREPPLLTPDSVLVSGPISIVEFLSEWPTDSIVISQLKADQKIQAPLLAPANESIKLEPPVIDVNLFVELFVEKDFFVPVQVNLAQDSIHVVPYPRIVRVTAVVGMSRFNDLKAEDFVLEAMLDGIEIRSENDLAPLQITKAPDYVRNIRLAQQSARFIFTLTDSLATDSLIGQSN